MKLCKLNMSIEKLTFFVCVSSLWLQKDVLMFISFGLLFSLHSLTIYLECNLYNPLKVHRYVFYDENYNG